MPTKPDVESQRSNIVGAVDQTWKRMFSEREFVLGITSTDPTVASQAQDKVRGEVGQFSELQNQVWTTRLLQMIGKEDQTWTTVRRNAALEMLKVSDFKSMDPNELLKQYLNQVPSQIERTTVDGSITTLLEAGKVLADQFPKGPDIRMKIRGAWYGIEKQFRDIYGKRDDALFIGQRAWQMEQIVDPPEPEERLGRREKPNLEPSEQALHDEYLRICSERGSVKLTLWSNTPEFRNLAQAHGINLAQFWNLHSPEQVTQAALTLRNGLSSGLLSSIDQSLKRLTGTTLTELNYEQGQVISDQIVEAIKEVRGGLRMDTDSDIGVNRLRVMMQDPRMQDEKFRRSVRRAAASFLQRNGISVEQGQNPLDLINNPDLISQAQANSENKRRSERAAAEAIDHMFAVDTVDPRFSIAGRKRDDLFIGDMAGDCTSYHLNVGMNAWTTPAWFSDPGFSMFTIKEGNQLIAKFGMFLSLDNDTPVLTIDSVEAGKGIKDEEAAKKTIREGLDFINRWAKKAGLKATFINTISNSSDLSVLLGGVEDSSNSDNLTILGGKSGLQEFQSKIGIQTPLEKIYVQSEGYEEEDNQPGQYLDFQKRMEITHLARDFEDVIADTLKKATPEQVAQITEARHNWPKLFQLIIDTRFPELKKYMDTDLEEFNKLFSHITVDFVNEELDLDPLIDVYPAHLPSADIAQILVSKICMEHNRPRDLTFKNEVEEALNFKKTPVHDIYNDVDIERVEQDPYLFELTRVIKLVESKDATMDQLLEQLYGKSEESSKQISAEAIKLMNLSRLKMS